MNTYSNYNWMDWLRGYAVLMIIFHHWLGFIFIQTHNVIIDKVASLLFTFSGNSIHIFFVLSGAGLAVSFFTKPVSWKQWFIKRLRRIIVPFWIIVIFFYVLLNFCHYFFPAFIKEHFDPKVLVAYLTLTRNFYEPAVKFNLSLWFVPNIVGLYCVFPVLIAVFMKINRVAFLFLSLAISFCSILLFLHFGLSVIHENSIFLFFIFEFAFGIFIGYRLTCHPIIESKIKIVLLMLLGVLFYSISYYLVTKTSWGENFNKPFTSLGLLFITYSLFFVIQRLFPMLFKYFKEISSSSYYMYLIHFPIVYYFLSKIKTNFSDSIFINLAAFVFTYAIFCCCIYFVSKKTENVINGIMRHFSAEIKS